MTPPPQQLLPAGTCHCGYVVVQDICMHVYDYINGKYDHLHKWVPITGSSSLIDEARCNWWCTIIMLSQVNIYVNITNSYV